MPNWFRLALSLLQFRVSFHSSSVSSTVDVPDKRIAIVGGGTGGIVMLKTLVDDLPKDLTQTRQIVLFEQRDDVGGIWYPDPHTPHPPDLPESPLYPRLRTNTPHPSMTISRFPFPPGTALFPDHTFDLSSYIRLRHEVLAADWHGDNVSGHWQLTALDHAHNRTVHARFDHLIVATGHFHYPYEPVFQGQQVWEASAPGRKILHSIFYREPEVYRGRNILVVGGGASGQDIAQQIAGFANSVCTICPRLIDDLPYSAGPQTYVSLKSLPLFPFPFPHIPGVERVGAVSHFAPHAPVFEDGTSLPQIDTVLLATGYELRIPFLPSIRNTTLSTPLPDPDDCDALTNNGRYLRPLFRHVLSLAPTHAPSRPRLHRPPHLGRKRHIRLCAGPRRRAGPRRSRRPPRSSPTSAHRKPRSTTQHASDTASAAEAPRIRTRSSRSSRIVGARAAAVPPRGTRFTEPWREFATSETMRLRRAWLELEARGEDQVRKWLGTVERGDEAEWAELMVRLVEWYEDQVSGERDG
ncbi:hypothetical protein EDB85DRAFT_2226217 [Lactarius pseudohatsudake]|nr:hypothetical protein EDB85DRAFT_2226217 [Lactarius pseudohatsudake]